MTYLKNISPELIDSAGPIVLLIPILATIIFNALKIIKILDLRKEKKMKFLEATLDSQYIGEEVKDVVKRELENENFYRTTGIRAETVKRNLIISLHSESEGQLEWPDIRRARSFIKVKNRKIEIKIDRLDKIHYYLNLITGFFFLATATIFIFLSSTVELTAYKHAIMYASGFISLTFSLFMISMTFPITSAKKITEYLKKGGAP